jgi:broad specificity phosphatase PhoE
MTRTKHTANIVNSKNVPVIYDDRLKERDARDIEGIDVDTIDYKAFWTYGKDSIFPSETIEECKNRIYEF